MFKNPKFKNLKFKHPIFDDPKFGESKFKKQKFKLLKFKLAHRKNTTKQFNKLSINETTYRHNISRVFTVVKDIPAKNEKNYSPIFYISCFENDCVLNP